MKQTINLQEIEANIKSNSINTTYKFDEFKTYENNFQLLGYNTNDSNIVNTYRQVLLHTKIKKGSLVYRLDQNDQTKVNWLALFELNVSWWNLKPYLKVFFRI